MKQYEVFTCGYYLNDTTIVNGQSVRTETITKALSNKVGRDKLIKLSYANWKANPIKMLFSFNKYIRESKRVIIFPDTNAMKLLAPLAYFLGKLYHTKIYYNVIGGWLPAYLANHSKALTKVLSKFDGLFVQTQYLKDELTKLGIANVVIFPNFKNIRVLGKDELPKVDSKPLNVFFMSRILKEKGIEYLVSAIKKVNSDKVRYILDIYGPIDKEYMQQFEELQKSFTSEIKYCGVAAPDRTSEVASGYFLHIFPTVYNAEGFAGCVIDSLCAGVPTLASKWPSFADVIDDGETGLGFAYGDEEALLKSLYEIYEKPERITSMREKCLEKAVTFEPDEVMKIMVEALGL